QSQLLGSSPQVRILQTALVGEQQLMHLPEPALHGRRLGGAGGGPGSGMARANWEMAEDQSDLRPLEALIQSGAVRAFEVGVLDEQRSLCRAPYVILGRRLRKRS